jgi:hypothetical protein
MEHVLDVSRRATPTKLRGRVPRAALIAVVAALGVASLASCRNPGNPPGGGTGRYRSEVFTSVTKTANIPYSQAPGRNGVNQTLLLDIYRPAGDTATNRPLLITAYGGAFIFGSKDNTADPAYALAQRFARMGYVTAMINYRLLASGVCTGVNSSESCRNAAIAGITDGLAAVRFLRANAAQYGIDPNRITIAGDSAGGVVAAGTGVMADVDINAPIDGVSVNRSTPGVSGRVQAFMALSGGLPDAEYIGAGDSPGILFHGTADFIVPVSFATTVGNALTAAGIEGKTVIWNGAGHVPWAQYQGEIVNQSAEFFYRHLGLAGTPA